MSVNPKPNTPCPNEEIFDTLRDSAELEAALGLELARLRRTLGACEAATPLWWWRTMLLRWAWRPRTRELYAQDLLDGLIIALEDFADEQLRSYLEAAEEAGRKTA